MNKRTNNSKTKTITISLAHLVHDVPGAFLAPILPLLIEKFGLTVFLAGMLDTFRRIPAIANPFLGLMADRVCIRWFIILMPGTTAILMSLLGVAPGYAFLAVLLLLSGISSALFHVTAPVMVRYVSKDRIGMGMSFYMLGGELARTLGPLIILGAVSLWGLEGTYRLVPFGIVATILLYFMLKDVSMEREAPEKHDEGVRRTFIGLVPFFICVTGIFFCRAAMKSALTLYLPTFLTSRGASLWMAGISLAVLQFSGAAGTFLAGIISDRIGRKATLLIITAVNPFLMWLFIWLEGRFSIPVLIITGFFLFASGPVLLALVHDIDSKRMSFINGIYMTLNFTLSSIMVLLVGFSADKIGLDLTFRISAFLAAGSVPFVLFLKAPGKGLKDR
ncbi:MAG: MFS transporter [Candidatus Krumholzibacteria bacterium]|nr:MFS transporter [Candidatus Krumholzibacteria bacterium]